MKSAIIIRNALESEYTNIGQLLVKVYSKLDGFPKENEQPEYYKTLANVGEFTKTPGTEIIVAVNLSNQILGSVVNFSDMKYYGSGGIATQESNSGGFRLLAVENSARGKGIGKSLTLECIQRAKNKNLKQVIIHTTKAMEPAWKMYEKMGFRRSEDLDFKQGALPIFGFRFYLDGN
jgi:GNAT superfamily N-acetyltransferase